MNLLSIQFLTRQRRFRHQARYEWVLGTALELQIVADQLSVAREAEERVLQEIDRLEAIYSRYLPESELNRWQKDQLQMLSPDLVWLLHQAQVWQQRTGGSFSPAAEAVQSFYRQNPSPTEDELDALCKKLGAPLWELKGHYAHKLTPLELNFNAIAKGRIADLAARAAMGVEGVQEVMVNLGGDLRHLGENSVPVLLAHPFSSADNATPLARVHISDQGIATSGHTQRGKHLFDPRTARAVSGIAQATVMAADAATADVLATAFCVLEVEQSLALAERYGVGCLMVSEGGKVYANVRLQSQCSQNLRETI